MKKLMIAAAIVCAAVVSQAAQYEWVGEEQLTAGYAGGSGEFTSGIQYLINANNLGYEAAIAALEAGEKDTIISAAYFATDSIEDGKGVEMGDAGTLYGVTQDITFSEGDSIYAVVFETGTDWAYITTALDSPAAEPFGATTLEFDEAARSAAGTGWYTATATPEPTSGLLLLLGVAGLALRRRRA